MKRYIFVVILAAALSAGSAFAQVGQIKGGHALDANTQVGSGGVNSATGASTSYRPYTTNLYGITESRGLSAFHGHIPTLSNVMSLKISTGGVSKFNRQSVGVGDISSKNLYNPQDQIYIDPLQAVLRTPQIVHQAESREVPLPGTRHRPSAPTAGAAKDLYVDAAVDYRPLMPTQNPQALAGTPTQIPVRSPNAFNPTGLPQEEEFAKQAESADLIARGGKEMFGMLGQDDQARLARELREFDANEKRLQENASENKIDAMVDASVDGLIEQDPTAASKTLADRLAGPENNQPGRVSPEPGDLGKPLGLKPNPNVLPEENQDTFTDLLVNLRQKNTDKPQEGGTPARRYTRKKGPGPPNVELTKANQLVLHQLAGGANDLFNLYMKRAKVALQAGRYYEASRQYELAAMTRPQNPLPHIGSCLASFSAGEWYTAGQELERAMEIFPPIMEVQLDMRKLIPMKDFNRLLGQLENWISTVNDKPVLLLLAAYLQTNNGNDDEALRYAKLLKRDDKQSTGVPVIMRAYANYLISGKLPADAQGDSSTPTK